jgi:hypothetical protein
MDLQLLDLDARSVSKVRIANRQEADLRVRPPLGLLLDNSMLADYYCSACTALAGS